MELVEESDYDLKVSGNPLRPDGSVSVDRIDLLVGPEGVKLRMPDAPKRQQLRARMARLERQLREEVDLVHKQYRRDVVVWTEQNLPERH